jgi:DNA-directed RNA polymerase subunit beta'
MRSFSGAEEFQKLTDTVIDSYKKLFPIEKNGHRIEATKIWFDSKASDATDYADQKKVKLAGGTWGSSIRAALVLKDNNGKIIDKIDDIRIATVPRLTPRKSYIVGGNEYQVANQMIRKPGAYIVPTQKGDFKGMISLRGESQKNFNMGFDPETNRYSVDIGQAELPLFPLLQSLGATDKELIANFGEQIFLANKSRDKDHQYGKLAEKLTKVKTDNKQTAMEAIAAFAKTTKVDPEVSKITLGHPHEGLSKALVMDTAKKLLNVYQGKKETDDPENLVFKEIRSVEDMLHDKLTSKDQQESLKKMLQRHLGIKTDLKKMIDFRKLTAPVEGFFISDNRTSTPEQYNPIHMLSEGSKLTVHGTGGIESEHAVSGTLREVHPSHIGFVDPIHTPESDKIGTVLHLASGVQKNGREINAIVYNPKNGKVERLTPHDLYHKVVAFPDEYVNGKFRDPSNVRVQTQGKVMTVSAAKVDAVLPAPIGMFSHATNLIPFLKNNQGTRGAMASKQLGQALPLVDREAPHVQTELASGKTFHQAIGEEFSVKAPKAGTVKEINKNYIMIDNHKVNLYNNFPLNQKTQIHHEPKVAVGDKVKEGQLIADSNFTKNGELALGKNMSVAYLPIPGHTFEDGIVITESAAKKLAAEQNYKQSFRPEAGKFIVDIKKWVSYYGSKLNKEVYQNLDSEGVVKKGTIVKPGDLLIAGLHNNVGSPENMTLKKINKSLMIPWADASVSYKGEFQGTVTDVVKRADGVHVYIKAIEPAKESDKLSGVHGNKGVISKVIPDHEAPRTADGKIPDIFLNPHGIISRINLGQLYESAAGKIAAKTGKTYTIKNFESDATNKKIYDELKQHGLSDTEVLFDPNGKKLGDVHVGNPYVLRLAKTGKSGFSARTPGTGYDNNLQPLRGGEEGTKALDALTFYSMLSHGAKKNLIDAHQKSEKNDEYWHAIETGKPVPAPKETFAFQKFTSLLKGAGINVEKKGQNFTLAPMTDKDVLKISKGEVKDPRFFYGKNQKEIQDGFFDPAKSGGVVGKNYTHIELHEPMPNPVFESAIKSLTNLTGPEYQDIVTGKRFVSKDGKIISKKEPNSLTGGKAISELLKKINVDSEFSKSKSKLKALANANAEPGIIDKENRKVRYLSALKDLNMSPDEAYVRKTVPVIPPQYRPVQEIEGVGRSVSPANYLYQNVGILTQAHDHAVMKLLDDSEKTDLRDAMYKSTRALAGLEPVYARGKDQPIEGFISQISSDSPKRGFFLNKLLTKKQDLVGRGVITNGPDLHVDQIGIPEKMAWKIFRPFIIRKFVMSGYKPEDARKQVDENTPTAHKMLESVMKDRTVMMNRAPSLHKFSIMAFKPVLSDGLAIKVPPLVFKGFNADIDGDAVSIHVPVSDDALKESLKMMPSNNLWKPGTGELMMVPSQESAIGLYFLSQSQEGRKQINSILPAKYHIDGKIDKAGAKKLFEAVAKNEPTQFANLLGKLKSLGDQHAYDIGFSANIKDLLIDQKARDAYFAKADKAVSILKSREKAGAELDKKVSAIYEAAAEDAYKKSAKTQLKTNGSSFFHMVESGAKGTDSQLRQLVSAPGIMIDSRDRKIPVPVKKSYAEGLTTSDYFISSYGVRKGMIDRALQTSKPGALNKDIIAASVDNIITAEDCNTSKGATLSIDRTADLYGRFLAKDVGGYKKNTEVTPQVVSSLKSRGAKTIDVRSPLGCIAPKGTCAMCFGHDENGHKVSMGDNIGATMGQAMSERVTQMTMQTFHTGGVSGGKGISGFARVNQLLSMPKYVAGEAALAPIGGKITKIEKSEAGGHVIHVGDKSVTSRPGVTLKIKVGDKVSAGDAVTTGVIKPQSLAAHKGMEAAQNYIVDELQKTYGDQNVNMHRKVFETVVKSLANNTKVIEAPKHSSLLPGDLIPYTQAKHYNESRRTTVNVDDAEGYTLDKPVGKLPAMHEITHADVAYLKSIGHRGQIEVIKDALRHAPVLKSIRELPMLRKDWMAQLGYQKIKAGLTEGAAQNWKSNVEGTHPVPAFAYGVTFGKKKETY